MAKRVVYFVLGGLGVPMLLVLVGLVAGFADATWIAEAMAGARLWPLTVWNRVFPFPDATCDSCGPSNASLLATIATLFVVYALLTVAVIAVKERHVAQRKASSGDGDRAAVGQILGTTQNFAREWE